MSPKMGSLDTQNLKKSRKQSNQKNIKSRTLKKLVLGWKMTSLGGWAFRSPSLPRTTKIVKIQNKSLRTSKITKNLNSDLPKSLKIMIPTSQNLDNLIANCCLFGTQNPKKYIRWFSSTIIKIIHAISLLVFYTRKG